MSKYLLLRRPVRSKKRQCIDIDITCSQPDPGVTESDPDVIAQLNVEQSWSGRDGLMKV